MAYTLYCEDKDGNKSDYTSDTRQELQRLVDAGHKSGAKMFITNELRSRYLRSDLTCYRNRCPSHLHRAMIEQNRSLYL